MGRRWTLAAALGAAAIASACAGWFVTDWLERDNDFCTACHLQPDRPLHVQIRREFDAIPSLSLAGLHHAAGDDRREDGAFRCIDCHGGVGLVGRARVKVLAAKDAFWYAIGHFDEPTGMRWPLWDEDCTQCHDAFDESEVETWESPRFHQLPLHNVDLGVDCVECHRSHGPGGNPEASFLHTERVRTRCARCHSEFQEGE